MVTARAPAAEEREALEQGVDLACAKAADAIAQADILLLCTGAGFSADSGLAVYADVAQVPAYKERGLQYHDICSPHWMTEEPELFWGFWGQCFNDYRSTAPHAGYEIIERWVAERFRHSPLAEELRDSLSKDGAVQQRPGDADPYVVAESPGAFFVFTSNVDAHHFDCFRACEIRECHGNTELFQCGAGDPCDGTWRAPADFRFQVDTGTMLAPSGLAPPGDDVAASEAAVIKEEHQDDVGTGSADEGAEAAERAAASSLQRAHVGHVRGGGRPQALRHMPPPTRSMQESFRSNHPTCIHCGGAARPAILMFGDYRWLDVDSQARRWCAWQRAVDSLVASRQQAPRCVILELGAGGNVPTVRWTSESRLRKFLRAGADATLVRISPDSPLGDESCFAPGGSDADRVISVLGRGLLSLTKIDACLEALK